MLQEVEKPAMKMMAVVDIIMSFVVMCHLTWLNIMRKRVTVGHATMQHHYEISGEQMETQYFPSQSHDP